MSFKQGYSEGKALGEKALSFLSIFTGKTRVKKRSINTSKYVQELKQLHSQVQESFQNSSFSQIKAENLAIYIVTDAFERIDQKPIKSIAEPLYDLTMELFTEDDLLSPYEIDWNYDFDVEERIELKKELSRLYQIYEGDEKYLDFWANHTQKIIGSILLELPLEALSDQRPSHLQSNLANVVNSTTGVTEGIIGHVFEQEAIKLGLFNSQRDKLEINLCRVSNIPFEERYSTNKEFVLPQDSKLPSGEILDQYLSGTVFKDIFSSKIPFSIPESIRFEHTHILAGTGHGKTQLIQTLILDDINQGRGFCVIDSQGDLIQNIATLNLPKSYTDKIVIVDPEDITYPACLNIFALTDGLKDQDSSFQKELIYNQTVDLYSYLFSSLFGAELTSKQATVFSYMAKLLIEIPDANIHTLRQLLEDGKQYLKYTEHLSPTAQAFFKTEFFSTSFRQSKKQVLSRLWTVLSNSTLEKMFTNTENKINVDQCLNEGKILLINTSKQLLQKEGSAILGRFFIALISQAIIKRSSIPEEKRNPYMVYIDEAHEYFDYRLEDILNQARKYKIGFTLSHQNLGQLGELKSTVFSSTSLKLAGGVSAQDSKVLASEMRCSSSDIQEVKKDKNSSDFCAYIKNVTDKPTVITVPFGLLESQESLSSDQYTEAIQRNREKYCNHISKLQKPEIAVVEPPVELIEEKPKKPEVVETKPKKAPKVLKAPDEGKGGITHRYLQNSIKKIAQQRGFKATTEKQVLSNTGQVDVFIEDDDMSIACEVSVSTDWKHEAENITKCLASGADQVIVMTADKDHFNKLTEKLASEFSNKKNLFFFTTQQLISHLDKLGAKSASKEKKVDGYKVKVKYSPTSDEDGKIRKDSVAKILLGVNG